MNDIEKMQTLIETFGRKMYQGAYLWKYVESAVVSGIYTGFENLERDVAIQNIPSDDIPRVPREQAQRTEQYLNSLSEKEVLFGTIGIRRFYKGKLEQNALDAYTRALDENMYAVIESKRRGQEDEKVYTRNRIAYDIWEMVEYYGQDEVDKDSLIDFFVKEYIHPIEQAFHTRIPRQILVSCVFKLSGILKIRRAHLLFFDEVLKRIKPKVVCFTHGRAEEMCFLSEAAAKRGIPTVEIPHGAVASNIVEPDALASADYNLTYSDLITASMRRNGIRNTYTVGKPEIYESIQERTAYEKITVISFISSLEPDMLEKSIRLAKRLQGKDYLIIYKNHSAEMFTHGDAERIMKENPNWKSLGGMTDIRDLFKISDIIVGTRSTGLVEALPHCNIEVIAVNDGCEKQNILGNCSFFEELNRLGDIKIVNGEEELYQEVLSYKKNQLYRNEINHFWAPNASQRFRDFIQIFLDGNRPQIQ